MGEEIKRDYTLEYKWWDNLEKKTRLEQAFAIGCNDKEACAYAEISPDQLYYYTSTVNPEFQARKEELKEKPLLKAKQTVVNDLSNVESAKWYLERKNKKEFANRSEITGSEGEKLTISFDTSFNATTQ